MLGRFEISAVFPQAHIGTDPQAIAGFAQTIEDLGYRNLIAYDHVVGANPASRPGRPLPYTHEHSFHEPLVLFGFLANVTKTLILSTGVVILPQRQTVLFAKQAATVDILSGGRLRLGIGIGWNDVEYEALGVPFAGRGERLESQLALLRELWAKPLVTHKDAFHTITDAGINPLPLKRAIPIWLGGNSGAARRRAARQADGWLPYIMKKNNGPAGLTFGHVGEMVAQFRSEVEEAGRDPAQVGVETIIFLRPEMDGTQRTVETIIREVQELRELGLAGVAIDTQFSGIEGADAHATVFEQIMTGLR